MSIPFFILGFGIVMILGLLGMLIHAFVQRDGNKVVLYGVIMVVTTILTGGFFFSQKKPEGKLLPAMVTLNQKLC